MTRDEITRMARAAGVAKHGLGFTCWEGHLERFAALVASAEREECAKLAAWILKMPENDVSSAIRARGNDT